jgi:HK97 family phage portal protein
MIGSFARKSAPADSSSWGGLAIDAWLKLFGGGRTKSSITVDADSAMQMSAVWSCVRILAESVGMLPWAVYESDGKGNSRKIDHDLSMLLTDSPNSDMTDVELKEAKVVNLALNGNGYSFRENRDDGSPSSLYPLTSAMVIPQRDSAGTISYKVLDRGKWEVYPQEKIWHVKGFGANGLIGFSPIAMMREAIGLGLALEDFNARFFAQGARSSGIVTVPDWLDDKQRAAAKKILAEKYEGRENAHKLFLAEGGMTFTSNMMPLEDAQFMLSRGMQVEEICRTWRVPPHMVMKMDRATDNNIEHSGMEFGIYTLQPYLVRLERSARRWLLPVKDRAKYFVKFNMEGLLRADSAARGDFYSKMLQNGVYNRNEIRALENMNRVEGSGMDEYTVQSNMAPIDALMKLLMANQGTPPAAPPAKVHSIFSS